LKNSNIQGEFEVNTMNDIEQLEKLAKLKEAGIVNEDEFQKKKAEILGLESVKPASSKNKALSEEAIVWSGTPSQVTNLLDFIVLGLISVFIYTIPLTALWALWKFLITNSQKYELTTQRLKITEGILSQKIDELELYRVTDIRFEQSFFGRIFDLGDIILITTDKTSPKIAIKAITNAKELREKIRHLVDERRDKKHVREVDFN
jgi:uncharacterized membrane protein YdbT with pleckstrin-like domain